MYLSSEFETRRMNPSRQMRLESKVQSHLGMSVAIVWYYNEIALNWYEPVFEMMNKVRMINE